MPRNVNPEVAHHKARVAALTMRGADPGRIAESRRELFRANARAKVATWRCLTAEERAELAVLLLTPAGGGDAG